MSSSADAESDGFTALLDHGGESLTFRTGKLAALVDRDPFGKKHNTKQPQHLDLNARDVSEIQILTTVAKALAPKTGESFKDEFGHYHRIETWKCIGVSTSYNCTVSDA